MSLLRGVVLAFPDLSDENRWSGNAALCLPVRVPDHRDLKPANIFVCERGGLHDVIKILDFGLVREVGAVELPALPEERAESAAHSGPAGVRLTQAGHVLGTPTFMSPEQVRGEETDPRSDIYSLGAVAYCLLAGRPPFERATLAELYAAHLAAPVTKLRECDPRLPSDLEAVVLRCLCKHREERFQSVQELDAALASCTAAATWDEEQAARWWARRKEAQQKSALATLPFDDTQAGA